MNRNEILEVEIEFGESQKIQMNIQLAEDWYEIEKGTRALMMLINGEQFAVEINSACEDDGVSFKTIGGDRSYHYDANVVEALYVEVKE